MHTPSVNSYDNLVFIGRFQPFHNGHLYVITEGLKFSKRLTILIGSSNTARTPRNPWTFHERELMIRRAIPHLMDRITILPLEDYTYNDALWIGQVQSLVDKVTSPKDKIGLIGYSKDHSSYYLKMFPQWGAANVQTHYKLINSTELREGYFRFMTIPSTLKVPLNVADFMVAWTETHEYIELKQEDEFFRNYRKSWEGTPYPVFINCVDAVVVQSGHILLVERGHRPGLGQFALPGGHVNIHEPFIDAVVRELKEETRIEDKRGEIPPAMLKSFINPTKTRLFDDPHRSLRGRVITQAYYFDMPSREQLFKVRGDDDAAHAKWYPLGSIEGMRDKFFEDHYHIIREML